MAKNKNTDPTDPEEPNLDDLSEPLIEPAKEISAADLQGPGGFALFATFMDKLVTKITEAQMSPAALKDILTETGKISAEAAQKARWPENASHPHISVYSYPEGDIVHPKPKLVRDTFFCGVREEEDRLTPGEIDAYNAIDTPREIRGGAWRAVIKKSKAVGGKETLEIYVPKDTVDQRMMLPSLHLILHELNGGPSTEDVMLLVKQVEMLKGLLVSKGATAQELEAALLG